MDAGYGTHEAQKTAGTPYIVSSPPTQNGVYPNECSDPSTTSGLPPVTRRILRREIVKAAVMSGLGISAAVYGGNHFDACPIEPYIPIWMFVGGIGGTVSALFPLLLLWPRWTGQKALFAVLGITHAIVGLFMLSWLIAGTYWVFHVSPSYDSQMGNLYCDNKVYTGSKTTAGISWGIFGLVFLLIGWRVYSHIKQKRQKADGDEYRC